MQKFKAMRQGVAMASWFTNRPVNFSSSDSSFFITESDRHGPCTQQQESGKKLPEGHFLEVLHTNWMQIWMLQTNLALAQKHKHIQTPNLTLFQALPLGFGELRHPEIPVLTPLKQLGNKHPPNLSEQRRLLLLKACHICSCLLSTGNLHNCWDWSLYWNSTLMLCCCLLLVLVGKSRRVDVKTSWRVRGWKETSSAPKCHQISNYSDLISLNPPTRGGVHSLLTLM